MKIQILRAVTISDRTGTVAERKPGEIVSVYHAQGHRLITHRIALWVSAESCDPFWDPIPLYRAAIPQTDKMLRKAHNK